MRCLIIFTTSLLLSISVLGPSVIMLLSNITQEHKMLVDLGEEENKKENKKEVDEKNSFFEFAEDATQIFKEDDIVINHRYLVKKYLLTQEITSPPPEYFI